MCTRITVTKFLTNFSWSQTRSSTSALTWLISRELRLRLRVASLEQPLEDWISHCLRNLTTLVSQWNARCRSTIRVRAKLSNTRGKYWVLMDILLVKKQLQLKSLSDQAWTKIAAWLSLAKATNSRNAIQPIFTSNSSWKPVSQAAMQVCSNEKMVAVTLSTLTKWLSWMLFSASQST